MDINDDATVAETVEVLLDIANTGRVQVVALPTLLEDILNEFRIYEERIATYKQSLLWYAGQSNDVRPIIDAEILKEDTPI